MRRFRSIRRERRTFRQLLQLLKRKDDNETAYYRSFDDSDDCHNRALWFGTSRRNQQRADV